MTEIQKILVILLNIVLFCNGRNLGIDITSNVTSRIFNGYDKDQIPSAIKGTINTSPLEVQLQFFIKNIDYLDDINMEFSLQFALRMKWVDERLSYESLLLNEHNIKDFQNTFIVIPDSNSIWYPDASFPNEKRGSRHDILQPNVMTRILPNGTVHLSIRLSIVFYCPMQLHWYPFDRPRCEVPVLSYSFRSTELKLTWHNSTPIEFPSSNNINSLDKHWVKQLPHFQLLNFTADQCDFVNHIGSWTCAAAYFTFERRLSYYFITIFLPCGIIVIISWLSFWFDVGALDARVALGITTILTMTNQMQGINQITPAVSYYRAADIFTIFCLTFVALSMLEFALVDYTLRRKISFASSVMFVKPSNVETDEKRTVNEFDSDDILQNRNKAIRIDKLSRILFPVCFFGFTIVYFIVCVSHR